MDNQIDTQAIIKKDFLTIVEIVNLFDVSAITVRRHIKSILEEVNLVKEKLKLPNQENQQALTKELESLSSRARKLVIGKTQDGKDIYLLELANSEAFANWRLQPTVKSIAQGGGAEADQVGTQVSTQTAEKDNQTPELITQKTEPGAADSALDTFGQKYVQLLESQLSEKDDTIKDLRETNKFLSITNGKLNEQLRLLLERPDDAPPAAI